MIHFFLQILISLQGCPIMNAIFLCFVVVVSVVPVVSNNDKICLSLQCSIGDRKFIPNVCSEALNKICKIPGTWMIFYFTRLPVILN